MKELSVAVALLSLAITPAAFGQQEDWRPDNDANVRLDAGSYHTGRVFQTPQGATARVSIESQMPVTVSMTWIEQWNQALRFPATAVDVEYRCVRQHIVRTTYSCDLPPGPPMVLIIQDERIARRGVFVAPNDIHVKYYVCQNCEQPQFEWVTRVKEKYDITPRMKMYSSFANPDHDGEQISVRIKSPVPLDMVVLPWRDADQLYAKPEMLEIALASTSCKQRGARDTTLACTLNLQDGPQSLVLVPERGTRIHGHKRAEIEVQDVSCSLYCDALGRERDSQIVSAVQRRIDSDIAIHREQIAVDSDHGVVTLSGSVSSDAARNIVARYAGQVDGVKTVVNNLEVAVPHAEPTQAHQPMTSADNPNDAHAPVSNVSAAPQPVTIPAGTQLDVRVSGELNSETAHAGDVFHGWIASPATVGRGIAALTAADVEGNVVAVKSAGRFAGQSLLTLQLTKLVINGTTYPLQTSTWSRSGSGQGKKSAAKIAGAAAMGAVLGALGGSKGAAIGAAAGAGVGGAESAGAKGEQIAIMPEAVISFTLQNPLTVTVAPPTSREPMR